MLISRHDHDLGVRVGRCVGAIVRKTLPAKAANAALRVLDVLIFLFAY